MPKDQLDYLFFFKNKRYLIAGTVPNQKMNKLFGRVHHLQAKFDTTLDTFRSPKQEISNRVKNQPSSSLGDEQR